MKILLANDDGIQAKGIQVLYERLIRDKENEVYVVAPDSNRSAVSHHITMFKGYTIKEHKKNQWAISGFPVDCACLGLISDFFDFKFDLVISGINEGANMGTDIIYSGTCGAARQAVLNGVPAIALSINPEIWDEEHVNNMKYEALADFAAKNLKELAVLASIEPPRIFVNVNAGSLDSYKGVKYCKDLCIRNYGDSLHVEKGDGEMPVSYVMGGAVPKHNENCDAYVVKEGYIAISRVYADPLATEIVDGMQFKL